MINEKRETKKRKDKSKTVYNLLTLGIKWRKKDIKEINKQINNSYVAMQQSRNESHKINLCKDKNIS